MPGAQDSDQKQRPIESAWKIIPTFKSRNIAATVRFYTEELGFTLGGIYNHDDETATQEEEEHPVPQFTATEGGAEEPSADSVPADATFCSVYAGPKAAANIYFFKEKDVFQASEVMIALGTEQLDAMYLKLSRGGSVHIAESIADTPWGYRQFTILDNDGNRLTFFKFLEGGNPGTS